MVKIQINGNIYEVEPGKNLLHTGLALGFDIPYFCYHPAFGSVGACRQCAVKKFRNADDKKGKIVMSCMEPVVEGLIISTDDDDVKAFRAAIIESLMISHPHDCPVCDEGGECHLQDMTVMTGHNYRRFNFKKRTYTNQYLGPYIQHEMNRCIQCYRCVRFYGDYAGGTDLHVFGSASHVYFGRHQDGKLESEFSGNLVEVCPTGVFTDKTLLNHYTRKWDLTNSPSICTECSLGCNIIISERYGYIRRVLNRYNEAVNGYFICDRGRFGYEYINGPERIKKVMARDSRNMDFHQINTESLHSIFRKTLKGKKLAGIGSPLASLESNFALEKLVGKENFYHGIPDDEYNMIKAAAGILKSSQVYSPSLKEVEKSDALLILGEDLRNALRLTLSVRQAARNKSYELAAKSGIALWNDAAVRDRAQDIKSPVFIASSGQTNIDDLAAWKYQGSPEDIPELGFAIVSMIDNSAPSQKNLDKSLTETIKRISDTLLNSSNPLIITGIQNKDIRILNASTDIINALTRAGKNPSMLIVFPECNSLGLGLMDGKPVGKLIDSINQGNVDTVITLENDLSQKLDKEKIDAIIDKCKTFIVLGHTLNDTSKRADVILPSGTFAESTGTIINNEGRAQRYYRVLPEDLYIRDSWKYLSEMLEISGNEKIRWDHFDDAVNSFTESYPFFSRIREIIPDSNFRYFTEKIARQTPRFSGRTAIDTNISVSEPEPPQDDDSPLNFSMEGFKGIPSSDLTPYYWSPGWNSPQAVNKYLDEPGGFPLDGNPGVLLFDKKDDNRKDYFKVSDNKK